MCTFCGCGEGETRIEGQDPANDHEHGHAHDHHHAHSHTHENAHTHDYGQGAARAHAPGLSQSRMVQIETDILAKNDQYAAANRRWFAERGILALNLVSSPGSGKTTLLERTIVDLKGELEIAVVEGDQQTLNDADRIAATGAPVLQVNTGKGCHLDAQMIQRACHELDPAQGSVLMIENVGNLVCPAMFDLGEAAKVVIISVTEGDDKPLKYPTMFAASDLCLINKIDLLPHVDFDVEACEESARRVNPRLEFRRVSATTGEGLDGWYDWLRNRRNP